MNKKTPTSNAIKALRAKREPKQEKEFEEFQKTFDAELGQRVAELALKHLPSIPAPKEKVEKPNPFGRVVDLDE